MGYLVVLCIIVILCLLLQLEDVSRKSNLYKKRGDALLSRVNDLEWTLKRRLNKGR